MGHLGAAVVLTLVTTAVATGVAFPPAEAPGPQVAMKSQALAAGPAPAGTVFTVDLGIGAEMVGFTWAGPHAGVEVRALDGDQPDRPMAIEGPEDGPDPGALEDRGGHHGDPVWLGHDVRQIEVRVTEGAPEDLTAHAVDSEAPAGDGGVALGALPVAGAAAPLPALAGRAAWSADESWRKVAPGCNGNPDYSSGGTTFGVVHHTAESNGYGPGDVPAIIRAIYHFHTHVNGWCDIGYNFLVDRFGGTWEGRAGGLNKSVIGAHSGGFNTFSTGVAVMGDFTNADVPAAAYNSLRSVLAYKLGQHGIDPLGSTVVVPFASPSSLFAANVPVVVPSLGGHRDVNATGCPGANLYRLLPRLRQDVAADIAFHRDIRFMGDWDGDGLATPGAYKDGFWILRNANSEGPTQMTAVFGGPGALPVVGDWNADGKDSLGVYFDGSVYLRNDNSTGPPDAVFGYGSPGDIPIAGDWNGDRTDTIGIYRAGSFFLRNSNTTGVAEMAFTYGNPAGDAPVVGDWDGDGRDGIGIFRAGTWFLRNSLTSGMADRSVAFGNPNDTPVPYVVSTNSNPGLLGLFASRTQRWGLGVARGSIWYLSDQVGGGATKTFPY
ncbi:MAG: N-acetylmuramoyl-L-alanine amidase [Acidimicrobiia bacterium]